MSKREILYFLFKRKWSLIGVCLFVVLLAVAFVYLLPAGYRAESKVLVEPSKSPTIVTETRFGTDAGGVLFTEIEIVLSRTVMEAVVDRLQLDKLPRSNSPIARFVMSIKAMLVEIGLLDNVEVRDNWIRTLLKDVKVKPILETNVFTIAFSDENPQLAADIVNAITDEYMAHHSRIYSYGDAGEFYFTNMQRARAELDRLLLLQSKTGLPDSARASEREVLSTGAMKLRDRLNELRLELSDIMTRFGPNHPRTVAQMEKIERTERQAGAELRHLRALTAADGDRNSLQGLIDSQMETYRSYKKQYDQALLGAAGDRRMINTHLVDRAAVPDRPRFPRLVYILLAWFAGSVLSLLIAMIREYYDHRVESPAKAERILGAPVIGSVPMVRGLKP